MLAKGHTTFGAGNQPSDIGPMCEENGKCNNKPENHEMVVEAVMKEDR